MATIPVSTQTTISFIEQGPNPSGLCQCGCGGLAPIAKGTDSRKGAVRGQPRRFIQGHQYRRSPEEYREQDCGYKSPCWIWQRFRQPKTGYGMRWYKGGRWLAHRVAWVEAYGPIPPGLFVCHHCDVPACVRPDHLFVGTHQDNMTDMWRKGRGATGDRSGARTHPERVTRGAAHGTATHPECTPRGENHVRSVLTAEQVQDIRRRYAEGTAGQRSLGREYGVSHKAIAAVLARKSWAHIP